MRAPLAILNAARAAVVRAFLYEAPRPIASKPWRRLRIRRLFISLALGVATSVVIAEFLAASYTPSQLSTPIQFAWRQPGADQWIVRSDYHGVGVRYQRYTLEYRLTVRGSDVMVPTGGWDFHEDIPVPIATSKLPGDSRFVANSNEIEVRSSGWPVPCLRFKLWSNHSGCFYSEIDAQGCISIGDNCDLPYLPEPGGLAANSTLFGLVWLTMIALTREDTRVRRIRSGLCPGCGYSRAGLEAATPCPECGAANTLAS